MKSKKFSIVFLLMIFPLILSLPFIQAETISSKAKSKISPNLLRTVSLNSEERINIIIVPESEKSTTSTFGLCSWCNTISWLCKIAQWLCGLFCGTDFELKAITSEGYIIGTIPSKNIGKLAESEHVKAILPDFYTVIKLDSIEAKVTEELKETNKNIIILPQPKVIANVENITIIKLEPKEKPKLWKIIPMFWKD